MCSRLSMPQQSRPRKKRISWLRFWNELFRCRKKTGVEMHLEADFSPAEFALFWRAFLTRTIKVNYDTWKQFRSRLYRERRVRGLWRAYRQHSHQGSPAEVRMVASKPSRWAKAAPILTMFLHAFVRIGYSGGFTLQVARGQDGDEVNWVETADRLHSPLWT